MPDAYKIVIEKNEQIALRDGTVTYADIYRPLHDYPGPVVVKRTPYDKDSTEGVAAYPSHVKLAEAGYAVVVQDVRGRFSSGGAFYPFSNETEDGYDTVAWAARQPWSNGAVALLGASYLGATTMLGARSQPPALKAIVAVVTTDEYYETWSYHGGALQLGFLGTWGGGLAQSLAIRSDSGLSAEQLRGLGAALGNARQALAYRPVGNLPGVSADGVAPWWQDWVSHTENDEYWRSLLVSDSHASISAAGLHIGGWFDIFVAGTIRSFVGLTEAGRAPQKLIIGPWAHSNYVRHLGLMDFGATAPALFSGAHQDVVRWLDRWVAGKEDTDTGAPVRYFLMGANRWQEASAWPPAEGHVESWHLHSGGSANSLRGDGVLSRDAPGSTEANDIYIYNPDRPVPTRGGNLLMLAIHQPGPWDQREVEERDDVLVYTSAPLDQDLIVVGPVRLHLWATTDGPDTDWTAKLVDVYEDGTALNLCDGIIRARYRESTERAELLTPGDAYAYTIDLVATANVFTAGHRLRVEISSSNFPRFDRNSNTGGTIAQESTGRVAVQHVHHTSEQPSWLELTVLPS
jgi:putative CocE/NonD family hydrolase